MMDYQSLFIILNLVIVESLLSVDNASALAAMVQHLPSNQKNKALRYGLIGAYVFRGACLFVASWLIKIFWLKIVGGAYLLYLTYAHFSSKEESKLNSKSNKTFWLTVLSVEVLDLSLSLDNIFAAVALSNKFWVVMTGVAIGILAMRFVAGWFVRLIDMYPALGHSAFIVIALLGFKLIISGIADYSIPFAYLQDIFKSRIFDICFSSVMLVIFFIPIIFKRKKMMYGKGIHQYHH